MSFNSARSVVDEAVERASKLSEKAIETGSYSHIREARTIIEAAEAEASRLIIEAQGEMLGSLGEGEDVVHDHPGFHQENLDVRSYVSGAMRNVNNKISSAAMSPRVRI